MTVVCVDINYQTYDTRKVLEAGIVHPKPFDTIGRQTWYRGWVRVAEVGAPVHVELHLNGKEVGKVKGESTPADPSLHAFALQIGQFEPASRDEIEVHVLVDDTDVGMIARIPIWAVANVNAMLTPIVLVGPGRSGTTLVMKLLGEHPLVVCRNLYSRETRFAQSFALLGHVCANSETPFRVPSPLRGTSSWDGSLVFQYRDEASAAWMQNRLGNHIRTMISDYYQHVQSIQGPSSKMPLFFAEKVLDWFGQHTLRDIYPGMRCVYLIRDPRDILFSRAAHNRDEWMKLYPDVADEADMLERLIEEIRGIRAEYDRDPGPKVLLRYEDLVRRDPEHIAEMFWKIDLPLTYLQAEQLIDRAYPPGDEGEEHKTTTDPQASLGRWRREASPELIDAIQTRFADELAEIGYGDDDTASGNSPP